MHNAGLYSSRGTYARMHCPSYSVEIIVRSPHGALSTSSSAVQVFKQDEATIPEQQDVDVCPVKCRYNIGLC